MALKQPIKTTTNANTTLPSQQLHLPPPQTFDILPPLHELLARVDTYHSNSASALAVDNAEDHYTLGDGTTDIGCAYTAPNEAGDPKKQVPKELNPKDLPTEVLEIKGRIRNALKEVEKLRDVDRSVEEQEEEIEELEMRIKKQREMLRSLAQVAKGLEGRVI